MRVIHDLGVGEVTVPGENAGNVAFANPVDQLYAVLGMILECFAGFLALFAFLESSKLKRIVLAAGADVVDEQVVVGNFVALLGVIPEPADVLDALARVVDEHVIDGNHALVAVARGGILLKAIEPAFVESLDVPVHFSEESIQAGLICGAGELAVDSRDVLALSDKQPGEILSEVPPLRFAVKQVAKSFDGMLNQLRKFHDPWHRLTLRGRCAPSKTRGINHKNTYYCKAA